MAYQSSYPYEAHLGDLAEPRFFRDTATYESARDCQPGLVTNNPFPTLSLLCTPPCVVYACLPRLAAISPKTTYQSEVAILASYLADLWMWEPNSAKAMNLLATSSLCSGRSLRSLDTMLRQQLSDFGMHTEMDRISPSRAPSLSGHPNDSIPPVRRSQVDIWEQLASVLTPPPSVLIDAKGSQGNSRCKPVGCMDATIWDWVESVEKGGDERWIAPPKWDPDLKTSLSLGSSSNDRLFMMGCLNAYSLLRFQMDGCFD